MKIKYPSTFGRGCPERTGEGLSDRLQDCLIAGSAAFYNDIKTETKGEK